jgi:hypothetical protein
VSGSRPSLFEEDGDLDLSGFSPKAGTAQTAVPAETVRKISEEGGFPSRAGMPTNTLPVARYRTGRTVLLNARVTQRARDRFSEIVEGERARYEAGEISHRVTLGEVVERALAALDREIGSKGGL